VGKANSRAAARRALSRLELQVMNVVWELGDCTSAQVIERFAEMRPLAPSTIRTVLAKLREKGYLKRVPSMERGYKFRPTVPRECVARRSLKDLLASLFEDSPRQAIAYLLSDADISDRELEEIRRLIDSHKQKRKGAKG
jgi:BlaI family penicillinase repressor